MSTSPQIVPLNNDPNATCEIPLNIDGTIKSYLVTRNFNEVAGYWTLTITDLSGNLILDSVPLVTGNVPYGGILGQFAYLAIGAAFVLNTGGVATPDVPDDETLGGPFQLLWQDTPVQT